MLVENWMSRNVFTIQEDDSMDKAIAVMKQNLIRMLPVMKKGRLTGVLTDGDLKRASASDATSLDIHELLYLITRIKVKSIMTKNPITVTPDLTVEETAEIFLQNKISGSPVVSAAGQLVGVITQTDIFRVVISLTGVGRRGVVFALLVEDRPGALIEAADEVRNHGGRLLSILTAYDPAPAGHRKVYIRIFGIRQPELGALQEKLGRMGELLYMVDHTANVRTIFKAGRNEKESESHAGKR